MPKNVGRSCIGLADGDGYLSEVEISVGAGAFWFVFGITLSDAPHWFPYPDRDKNTVLQTEYAGSTLEALFGGLAGIEDSGKAFDALTLSPRCAVDPRLDAGVAFTTCYPLPDGYCRYHWQFDRANGTVRIALSTSARKVRLRILLPAGTQPGGLGANGESGSPGSKPSEKASMPFATVPPKGPCRSKCSPRLSKLSHKARSTCSLAA
ncbi:MAG: hypothetical protein ACLFTU_09745, partial [Puniceicoccaceae bacterium]